MSTQKRASTRRGNQSGSENEPTRSVINLRDDQIAAFEKAKEEVLEDIEVEAVDAKRVERGRKAGEVPEGEIVRILCEAYTGSLNFT